MLLVDILEVIGVFLKEVTGVIGGFINFEGVGGFILVGVGGFNLVGVIGFNLEGVIGGLILVAAFFIPNILV